MARLNLFVLANGAALACMGTLASATFAGPPGSGWDLAFADEFNGTTLDTSKWSANSPSWSMPNSVSTMSNADVAVTGGNLVLSANRTGTSSFDSGAISSYTKYNLSGGYVEARIQLPSTPGSWPAFWGLYNGWPPEADILEYPLTTNGGANGLNANQYSTNYHYTDSNGNPAAGAGTVTTGSSLAGTWHTFGMNWTSNTSVSFYLDGVQKTSYTGSSVAQMKSMYMILDYAVGGWPGTPSTSQWAIGHADQMNVDYVRVYQANPNGAGSSNWNVNGGGSFITPGNWTAGVPGIGNQTAVFGRVGSAASAIVTMDSWQVFGGLTFNGSAGGSTAYTLGNSTNAIQLAGTDPSSTVNVLASSSSAANQTINANVELWSNVKVENDMPANTLELGGAISGAGALTITGPGTVRIGNFDSSYTGGTIIGTNADAVGQIFHSNSLGTGTVTIGLNGNTTTARMELIGNNKLNNAIDFRGRNNTSVGIQSLSGNSTLAGTISAQVGGGSYLIQSDAGLFTLGTAGASALNAGASGSRTFTLQGAGNGQVVGTIDNGAGTISLIKSGTGTWELDGQNTYTGTTTVQQGMLLVNGTIAGSAVTIDAGATLGGSGNVLPTLLTLNGTLSPGQLATKGLQLNAGSMLAIDLLGAGSNDKISVTGLLDLRSSSQLAVTLANGYVPQAGATFDLIDATTTTGIFSSVTLPTLGSGLVWNTQSLYTQGTLSVVTVPEPALIELAGIAVAGLLSRRRR